MAGAYSRNSHVGRVMPAGCRPSRKSKRSRGKPRITEKLIPRIYALLAGRVSSPSHSFSRRRRQRAR